MLTIDRKLHAKRHTCRADRCALSIEEIKIVQASSLCPLNTFRKCPLATQQVMIVFKKPFQQFTTASVV
jgi:hypothetical protein